MSNANPSRLGQANATGDTTALMLKMFSGEVLQAFDRESAFRPRHMVRTIPSGKSAQFPVTGYAEARYHVPGTEIVGQTLRQGEKLITIEDQLIADAFVANWDEALNHYELRSVYGHEIGEALARAYDQAVGQEGILNARVATAVIDGLSGGAYSNNASYASDGTVLYTGVFDAGVTLDGKDIPQSERYGFFRPVQYALLVRSEKPIDFDLNQGALGNGSIAMGNVKRINNIEIVKTNNLPQSDLRADTNIQSRRRADYSVTRGLIQHRNAVGTVQVQDITTESTYDPRRLGTLIVGRYITGHGGLRPEAGLELRTADPSA